MTDPPVTQTPADARLGAGMLGLLALCSAVGVGTIYFPQALLPQIAASLRVPVEQAALVVTAPQLGYAVGILAIVPLGDSGAQRRLLRTLFCGASVFGAIASLAPSLPVLVTASFLMGCATVVAAVLGPFAAGMVDPHRLGSVNSLLLSASIAGIIASRALAGYVGEHSWRHAYLGAAVLALLCAVMVHIHLPAPMKGTLVAAVLMMGGHSPRPRRPGPAGDGSPCARCLDAVRHGGQRDSHVPPRPGARSAMNTAYMVVAFAAGSLGSWAAVRLYHAYGWWAVPAMVAALAGTAVAVHATHAASGQAAWSQRE